jgi:hypothetical protein
MASRARRVGAVLGALLLSLVCGSCAVISGLDNYSQAACSGVCDAGPDRSAPRDASADAHLNGDDEGADAPDVLADAEPDAAVDAAGDEQPVPSDGAAEDAPTEAGCALGTPAHCSACGVACSSDTGAPTCGNSTCSYACAAGREDCNGPTAPNTDGCECAGTACCGTGCQIVHSSGLASPANYYDCSATGNTTQTQAMAACTGTGGTGCAAKNGNCGGAFGFGGTPTNAACGTVGGTCYCWVYSGQNAGQAHAGSNGCSIACSSGSTWN